MKEIIKYIIDKWIHDWKYCNCFFDYEWLLWLLSILKENKIEIKELGIGYYDWKDFDDHWEGCTPSDPYNHNKTITELYDFINLVKDQKNVYFELYFSNKQIHTIIDILYGIES